MNTLSTMTFHVRTTVFEGPLDLLLQLITRHQVEVTAVGLTEVVEEYLEFLDEMRDLDLDVTSEFLLIAATLVQLKAQSLLPTGAEMEIDEELELIEERDRLLSRLLVCVTFKDVAAVVRRRMQDANRYVPRTAGLDQNVVVPSPELTLPVDAMALASVAGKVFSRPLEEPDLDHLDLDLPSVEAAIEEMRARVQTTSLATFESLTEHCQRPVEVAAYFLALLELARWGLVEMSQQDWMSEIEIRPSDDGTIDLTSEWAQ